MKGVHHHSGFRHLNETALKKCLGVELVNAFHSSTGKAEAGESLSSRPAYRISSRTARTTKKTCLENKKKKLKLINYFYFYLFFFFFFRKWHVSLNGCKMEIGTFCCLELWAKPKEHSVGLRKTMLALLTFHLELCCVCFNSSQGWIDLVILSRDL